jgi:5-methylcytosine-specific restriction endonuclease McrA
MVNRPVLVLNQNYEPLNICRVRRAIPLLYQGKAELLENGRGYIHSIGGSFEIPSVIRMAYQIKRPRPVRKMTRSEIFNRDGHTCQYCGKKERPLTLDHVVPRRLGGVHTWDNVVAACGHCNRRKAGRTPQQAGMMLLSQPRRPSSRLPFCIPGSYLDSMDEWQKYLPGN